METIGSIQGIQEMGSPQKMAIPDELLKTQPELAEQELPFIKNVIRRLSPGKIFPDIYEDEYTFIIPVCYRR